MKKQIYLTLLAVACVLAIVCGAYYKFTMASAQTPKDFVEKYAAAYQREDIATLLKMTLREKDPKTDSMMTEDSLKADLESEFRHKSFNYVAWTHTRYASETDKGGYIRVEVDVDEARSAVILVRGADGDLRISRDPSGYEEP